MTEPLTREDWEQLVAAVEDDKASLHVTRNLSRSFFARVSARNIRDVTGLNYMVQRFIVLAILVIGVLTAIACLYEIGLEFESMAFIAVPLAGILWTVIAGFTTEMGQGFLTTLAMLAVALLVSFVLPVGYGISLALFAVSLSLYRIAHLLAQFFLLRLVTTSFEAWEMMEVHVSIQRHGN